MNGLVQVVVNEMTLRPNDGGLYIFRNRQRNKLKLLIWDRNGFFLGYKRLEKGGFDWPTEKDGSLEISAEQFEMLISGMPILRLGKGVEKEMLFL